MEVEYSYTNTIEQLYKNLVDRGIKYVAVDFDLTLISKHTGGWEFDPVEMVKHQHVYLVNLVRMLLENKDLKVVITTFGSSPDTIKKYLELIFPGHDIPIFSGKARSKNSHIEKAFGDVPSNQIVLIDDDQRNLEEAKSIGIHAIHCYALKLDGKIHIDVVEY